MEDSTLLKIALVCALIGIITLSLIIKYIEPNFSENEKAFSGGIIKVKGIIDNVRQAKNSIILDITETKNTKVILYSPKNFNITKGSEVEIIGKAEKDIIVVDKIRIIN